MRHCIGKYSALGLVLAASVVLSERSVRAADFDVNGDVTVIGSTLAYDCASASAPSGTTVTGCPPIDTNKAPDLYWRDNAAAPSISATSARTSATLTIPAGATVVSARLYWSAILAGTPATPPVADPNVVLDRSGAGAFTSTITADATTTIPADGPGSPAIPFIQYRSSANVTSLVQLHGSGEYRITDVDSIPLTTTVTDSAYSAWHLVVVYSVPAAACRHVSVTDAPFKHVVGSTTSASSFSGFVFPSGGTASLTLIGYAGGARATGDAVKVDTTTLTNALNPGNNFFNDTRSLNGVAVAGLVPPLSGAADSMGGLDLDTVDLASILAPGDSVATVTASTTGDDFVFGGFVGSVSTNTAACLPTGDAGDGGDTGGDSNTDTGVADSGLDTSIPDVLGDVLPDALDAAVDTSTADTGIVDTSVVDTSIVDSALLDGDAASGDGGADGVADGGDVGSADGADSGGGDGGPDAIDGADGGGSDTGATTDTGGSSDTGASNDTGASTDGGGDGSTGDTSLTTDAANADSALANDDGGALTDDQYVAEGSGCKCETPRSMSNGSEEAFTLALVGATIVLVRRRRR